MGSLLRDELGLVRQVSDFYLFHDHLEDINAPIYFHQFVERAASHRLQYLSEADFSTMLTSGFPKEVAATLEQISPDIVRTEQYMDFLRSRFFRRTLLCHAGILVAPELRPSQPEWPVASFACTPRSRPGRSCSWRCPNLSNAVGGGREHFVCLQ